MRAAARRRAWCCSSTPTRTASCSTPTASSRKGDELRANPRAALVFHWDRLGKQVRVEGRVEEVSAAEADAYWATRPRASQLAALASRAERPARNARPAGGALARPGAPVPRASPVPRPPHWTGYRVVPGAIEFWTHREHRLHDRELFTRSRRGWKRTRLQP